MHRTILKISLNSRSMDISPRGRPPILNFAWKYKVQNQRDSNNPHLTRKVIFNREANSPESFPNAFEVSAIHQNFLGSPLFDVWRSNCWRIWKETRGRGENFPFEIRARLASNRKLFSPNHPGIVSFSFIPHRASGFILRRGCSWTQRYRSFSLFFQRGSR